MAFRDGSVAARIIAERLPGDSAGDPLRPGLVLWACAARSGDVDDALPVAAAFYLFDRFLVLHAELGSDTSSSVAQWGLGQSLNAGDALYALAFRALAATYGIRNTASRRRAWSANRCSKPSKETTPRSRVQRWRPERFSPARRSRSCARLPEPEICSVQRTRRRCGGAAAARVGRRRDRLQRSSTLHCATSGVSTKRRRVRRITCASTSSATSERKASTPASARTGSRIERFPRSTRACGHVGRAARAISRAPFLISCMTGGTPEARRHQQEARARRADVWIRHGAGFGPSAYRIARLGRYFDVRPGRARRAALRQSRRGAAEEGIRHREMPAFGRAVARRCPGAAPQSAARSAAAQGDTRFARPTRCRSHGCARAPSFQSWSKKSDGASRRQKCSPCLMRSGRRGLWRARAEPRGVRSSAIGSRSPGATRRSIVRRLGNSDGPRRRGRAVGRPGYDADRERRSSRRPGCGQGVSTRRGCGGNGGTVFESGGRRSGGGGGFGARARRDAAYRDVLRWSVRAARAARDAGMTLTLEAADAYCRILTHRHYENFSVASRFVDARKRDLTRSARVLPNHGRSRRRKPRRNRTRATRALVRRGGGTLAGTLPVHPVLVALCHRRWRRTPCPAPSSISSRRTFKINT